VNWPVSSSMPAHSTEFVFLHSHRGIMPSANTSGLPEQDSTPDASITWLFFQP